MCCKKNIQKDYELLKSFCEHYILLTNIFCGRDSERRPWFSVMNIMNQKTSCSGKSFILPFYIPWPSSPSINRVILAQAWANCGPLAIFGPPTIFRGPPKSLGREKIARVA